MGVDVQLARGCPVVALDDEGHYVASTWLEPGASVPRRLRGVIESLALHHRAAVVVGIDAPRRPMTEPRAHYWQGGARGRWRASRSADRGLGRHCDLVVAALGLARPQWTPLAGAVPPWMALGFACFDALQHAETPAPIVVHEVFPSASYQLFDRRAVRIEVTMSGFAAGPKDMLDAYCAAATVREVAQGRGWLAGGGDGLGTIALPGPRLRPESAVHAWPDAPPEITPP